MVVAIIGIIVAIVVPVAMGARRSAARMREASGARGLMVAWTSYATDERGFVLPGYRSGLEARDENGAPIPPEAYGGDAEVRRRWPWRLAPWLGDDLRRLYHGENAATLDRLQAGDRQRFYYFASLYPSMGLNSTWVGGDEARFPVDEALPNGAPNPFFGMSVLRLNQRNCGGTEHLSAGLFHSGLTTDAQHLIGELVAGGDGAGGGALVTVSAIGLGGVRRAGG